MATIAVRFPAGRYHATPWGRHVNEGDVEWPPSPWRILRALLSVGFTKRGWSEVPEPAHRLVERLAEHPPSYRLPPATLAHTRHYMPVRDGRSEKTTKVLDAFLRFTDETPLLVRYPVDLPDDEAAVLKDLVAGLGYLGRAESWVDAELTDDVAPGPGWCVPANAAAGSPVPMGIEQVARIAPVGASVYATWRAAAVTAAFEALEAEKGRAPTKRERGRLEAAHPRDLVACLTTDTGDLQRAGWTQPPGSTRVLYDRPADAFETRPVRPPVRRPRSERVEAALLALASDRPTARVLPPMTRALPQMELLHQAVISRLGDEAPSCPALTGRDPATGEALRGHHSHAHYLPLDLDEDGQIDHVVVWAGAGLDRRARRALREVRRTWTKGEDRDILVTLAGFSDLAGLYRQLRARSGRRVAALAEGTTWVSVTPFVPPRHIKKTRHTLEDQVRDELASRGFPEPCRIERMPRDELVDRRLMRFVRARRETKPQPPALRSFGLRVTFDRPVRGPIAIGYASHYGLGVFAAEAEHGS